MELVKSYLVSKLNQIGLLLYHIGHFPNDLHILEPAVVTSGCGSVFWISRVQGLLYQDVIVESHNNLRSEVNFYALPKASMDWMALRSANAEIVVTVTPAR